MSAVDVLRAARHAGVDVRVDGEHLVLEALQQPPRCILDMLSRNKADVIALLRVHRDGWSAEDWRAFYDERAGIAEHDGGLPRRDAEDQAFQCCITEWLNRNPVCSPAGACLGCGQTEQPHDPVVPFGTDPAGKAWLHHRCWDAWHETRRSAASATLVAMGIEGWSKNR